MLVQKRRANPSGATSGKPDPLPRRRCSGIESEKDPRFQHLLVIKQCRDFHKLIWGQIFTFSHSPNEKHDKPRQGVVANTLKFFCNGAVGFIVWLGSHA